MIMKTLNTIEPNVGYTFEANGKKYIIEDKLSIARAVEAGKIELEMFDTSVNSIKNTLILAYNDLNGSNAEKTVKFADAAMKLGALLEKLNGDLKIEDDLIFRYAALMINTHDEDRRFITPEAIKEKLNDWKAEGLTATGFMMFVLSVSPNIKDFYDKYLKNVNKV